MKPNENIESSAAPIKFTGENLLKFLLAHLLLGLGFQFISFDKFQWIVDIFISIDAALPAFRTLFVHSKNPLGGKMLLLLWWIVLLPLGMVLAWRFIRALKIVNQDALMSMKFILSAIFIIILAAFGVYENSFKEHSVLVPLNISRVDMKYLVLRHGPIGVSVYLLSYSMVVVVGGCLSTIAAKFVIKTVRNEVKL